MTTTIAATVLESLDLDETTSASLIGKLLRPYGVPVDGSDSECPRFMIKAIAHLCKCAESRGALRDAWNQARADQQFSRARVLYVALALHDADSDDCRGFDDARRAHLEMAVYRAASWPMGGTAKNGERYA